MLSVHHYISELKINMIKTAFTIVKIEIMWDFRTICSYRRGGMQPLSFSAGDEIQSITINTTLGYLPP